MDYAIAKISTKGQLVIPAKLRKDIKPGDEFLIVRDSKRFVLRKMEDLAEKVKDDLIFAQRTEAAWQRIKSGKGITMSKEQFLKELEKW
jgi:AbrB family looped-hinge helix DNA binding protein